MYPKMAQECTPEDVSCLIFENKFLTALREKCYSAVDLLVILFFFKRETFSANIALSGPLVVYCVLGKIFG